MGYSIDIDNISDFKVAKNYFKILKTSKASHNVFLQNFLYILPMFLLTIGSRKRHFSKFIYKKYKALFYL